jgi:low affinity Fe/Cu permease
MIRLIQNSRDAKEIDEALKNLKDETHQLSDYLIGLEMQLVEQFEVSIQDRKKNITNLFTSSRRMLSKNLNVTTQRFARV